MKIKCTDCGRELELINAHRLNGKFYGSSCYKKQLAIIYRQFEDSKNAEYSAKCFSAIEIFRNKKPSNFQRSILAQWDECHKLTSKQLNVIIKDFTPSQFIEHLEILFALGNYETKKYCSNWIIHTMGQNRLESNYINNESINQILLTDHSLKDGFYYVYDIDYPENVYIRQIKHLDSDQNDEFCHVVKIIEA